LSNTAKVVGITLLWMVTVLFAYGKGHQQGRAAQLTMKQVLEVCEIQFVSMMKEFRKDLR
jgi:fructoselysine-6-P-deglycase FrlB-like protein